MFVHGALKRGPILVQTDFLILRAISSICKFTSHKLKSRCKSATEGANNIMPSHKAQQYKLDNRLCSPSSIHLLTCVLTYLSTYVFIYLLTYLLADTYCCVVSRGANCMSLEIISCASLTYLLTYLLIQLNRNVQRTSINIPREERRNK